MRSRKLVLKKEALTELTRQELGDVAGGDAQTKYCPTYACYPSWYLTCRISDVLADCPTRPFC